MSTLGAALITLLLVAAPALAGCGNDDVEGAATTRTATATPKVTTEIPAELAGTWTTTLKRSELEDPPEDLKAASSDWKLSVSATGGENNGPSLTFTNDEVGEIRNPVTVSGNVITLEIPISCRRYSYAIAGDELTLTSADRGCGSESVKSVLTHRPWQRADETG